ncbi:hypothetical protein [Flavobacterium kingsejongi]|uniref:Uncharacterized protein n=1 Tax=Flavobacterium kingsejongi TaxID=1678728 RepID=A0A2S1LPL9_9FLAO|nr:hypothetical protein [Flavobacterium kingsejongi]AWG25621.1 hypothetical protein FK004_10455 [Flavobacterium kingsejongi]
MGQNKNLNSNYDFKRNLAHQNFSAEDFTDMYDDTFSVHSLSPKAKRVVKNTSGRNNNTSEGIRKNRG